MVPVFRFRALTSVGSPPHPQVMMLMLKAAMMRVDFFMATTLPDLVTYICTDQAKPLRFA